MSEQAVNAWLSEFRERGPSALSSTGPPSNEEMMRLEQLLAQGLDQLNAVESKTVAELLFRRNLSNSLRGSSGASVGGSNVGVGLSKLALPERASSGRANALARSLPMEMQGQEKASRGLPGEAPIDPRALPLSGLNTNRSKFDLATGLPLEMRGAGGGGRDGGDGGGDPGGRVRRVFVVNWPKEFGGGGVGGIAAPGTVGTGGGASDPNSNQAGNERSRMMALMSMLGADPMMQSVMGGSRAGRLAIGLQTMGRQMAGVAGSDNPMDVAGGVLGAAGTAGLMVGGPVGTGLAVIALFGSAVAKATSSVMGFGTNLLKSNFQFAEFSAAMTNVQVQQEIRDVYYGMRTGNARAASAQYLADANEGLRRALEPTRNVLAGMWNLGTGIAVNQIHAMGRTIFGGDSEEPGRLARWMTILGIRVGALALPQAHEQAARNARQAVDQGDAGGLLPWIANAGRVGGRDPNPRAWDQDWHRPGRFGGRGPQNE